MGKIQIEMNGIIKGIAMFSSIKEASDWYKMNGYKVQHLSNNLIEILPNIKTSDTYMIRKI